MAVYFGNAELHQALMQGDLTQLKLLHERGVNFNVADATYGSPLTFSILEKNTKLINFLLDHGADPNFRSKTLSSSALDTAVMNKQVNIVKTLLARGANPNLADSDGSSPLITALSVESLELTTLLVEAGADVLQKNKYGVNALQAVETGRNKKLRAYILQQANTMPASANPEEAAKLGQVKAIEQWLMKNPPSALLAKVASIAAQAGHAEVIQVLLAHGLDPNAKAKPDDSMIHWPKEPLLFWAIGEGHSAVVKVMLDAGAKVDLCTQNTASALLVATANRKVDIVKLLLAYGADPLQADKNGTTALSQAREWGLKQISKILEKALDQKPKQTTSLVEAAKNGLVDQVKTHLAHQADPEMQDDQGATSLQWAVMQGNASLLKLLLDSGAKVQPDTVRSTWDYALNHNANPEIVKLLIEAGLDVNQPQFLKNTQFTPLQYAVMTVGKHVEEVLGLLLDAGADQHVVHTPKVPPNIQKQLDQLKALGSGLGRKIGASKTLLELAAGNRKASVYLKSRLGIPKDAYELAVEQAKKLTEALATEPMTSLANDIAKRMGKAAQPWKKRKGVLSFWVKLAKVFPGKENEAGEHLREYAQEVQQRGGHLIYHRLPEGFESKTELLFFPTSNPYVVMAACGTNGDNYGLATRDVVKWFDEQAASHPFYVIGCGYDFVDVRFRTPVADASKFVKELVKFCPDMDEGEGTKAFASEFAQTGDCFFWWD